MNPRRGMYPVLVIALQAEGDRDRVFDELAELLHELGTRDAVDGAMVGGQRQAHHMAGHELAVLDDGPAAATSRAHGAEGEDLLARAQSTIPSMLG